MSFAPTSRRGAALNWRLAVNGIQCASRSFGTVMRAMTASLLLVSPSPGGLLPHPLAAAAMAAGVVVSPSPGGRYRALGRRRNGGWSGCSSLAGRALPQWRLRGIGDDQRAPPLILWNSLALAIKLDKVISMGAASH